jgi:hypothetical protein
MIALSSLLELVNGHKKQVLSFAEAAMPESQFRAFRKLVLNEFGEKGLEGELVKLYAENRSKREG